jgi:hypothetical protein
MQSTTVEEFNNQPRHIFDQRTQVKAHGENFNPPHAKTYVPKDLLIGVNGKVRGYRTGG